MFTLYSFCTTNKISSSIYSNEGERIDFDKKSGKNFFTILDFVGQAKLMNDEDSRGEISFGPNYPPRVASKEASKGDSKVKINPLEKGWSCLRSIRENL